MRFLLLGNGTAANRGCEAIRQGTVHILHHAFGNPEIEVIDFGPTTPMRVVDGIRVGSLSVDRYSPTWFGRHLARTLGLRKAWLPQLRGSVLAADCVLSLGGDNFSLDYGSLEMHLDVMDYVLARKRPFIVWGGSVGPFDKRGPDYERSVRDRLARATAFFVREDVSFSYLRRLGMDNVHRVDDPAFIMERRPLAMGRLGFAVPSGAVGLNLSPLLARFRCGGDMKAWRREAVEIVRAVACTTGRPIVLVCHVMTERSNDHRFMSTIMDMLAGEVPLLLTPSTLSAPEYKDIISRLACFAGTRTHATIAAFSSGVPTLCLAYSIKGIGISRSILDSDEWVLRTDEMTPQRVSSKILDMLVHESDLRARLQAKLPLIHQRSLGAGELLKSLLAVSSTTAAVDAGRIQCGAASF